MEALSGRNTAGGWLRERLELSRVTDSANLRPMEGLRGIAVFLVFLVHYASLVEPWLPVGGPMAFLLDGVHDIGNVGVDLFFVLSGFLIYGGLVESRKPFAVYLRRRVRRIYPTFLGVFALYLVLAYATGRHERLPAAPPELALFLAQNLLLLPGVFPIEPLITVAWSLSYEFFFYLLVPLLVALAGLRARSRDWRIGFLLLITALALVGFALWGGPVRMAVFGAGMLLHELMRSGRGDGVAALPGLLAGLFAVAVPLLAMPGPGLQALRTALIALGFLVLCLGAIGRAGGPLGQALSWTPLRWLGNISYSYYLLHGLALQVFFMLVQRLQLPAGEWAGLGLLLPAWLATVPPCLLLFLVIERPLSLAAEKAKTSLRPQVEPQA